MKKLFFAGLLGTLLVPPAAMAQGVFDGTWKIDLGKTQMPKKPDVLVLEKGLYECRTCAPEINVKADGKDHKVSGHPYFDTVAIKVIDDHTVQETEKRDGKVVATSETKVAPDGKTASFAFTDSSNTSAQPVTGKGTLTRVAAGPRGSHAISGSWLTSSYGDVSDNGLTFTYRVDGDKLHMTTPTGQTYDAPLDGSRAPYAGDPGTTGVSVKRLGKNILQETDWRGSKAISIAKMTVTPDGRTMHITVDDRLRGYAMSYIAVKE